MATWKLVIFGLAVANALAIWWNNILTQEIWEDCDSLVRENGDLKVKIEVLKARRR